MTSELLKRFSAPFDVPDARAAEEIFLKTAGVHVPEVQALSELVHGDLSESVAGVAWWAEHLDSQRRALISDHLVSAVDSIDTNLCEAALHIFESNSAWSDVDRKHARVVQVGGRIRWPVPKSCADLLPEKLEKLHTAGFFRAIGSVLDCLAAAAIAVAAIPQNLLRADFDKLMRWLNREMSPTAARHTVHEDLHTHVVNAVDSAGPKGWLPWASDYRNMFVHRGRRTGIVKLDLETSIVDPSGAPIPRAMSTRLLLQDPARSDVESFVRYRTQELTLTEPASITMPALLESTMYVTRAVASKLRDVWEQRRRNPELLKQAREQWPDGATGGHFEGYAPGTVDTTATHFVGNPSMTDRIRAAGLRAGDDRLWSTPRKPE